MLIELALLAASITVTDVVSSKNCPVIKGNPLQLCGNYTLWKAADTPHPKPPEPKQPQIVREDTLYPSFEIERRDHLIRLLGEQLDSCSATLQDGMKDIEETRALLLRAIDVIQDLQGELIVARGEAAMWKEKAEGRKRK